jgi:hypothetical protein
MNPNMTPIPVPPEAAATRPHLKALRIGPPLGMTDRDCGTVEALAGIQDGYPLYADYWRPTLEQLEALAAGGFIELIQYAPRMVMHSMAVWTGSGTDTSPVEFAEEPSAIAYAYIQHIHVAGRCVKNRHGDRCRMGSCSWVDCQVEGEHGHQTSETWVNPGDPTAGETHVEVSADGLVTISEAALAQLLTDAGWERAR